MRLTLVAKDEVEIFDAFGRSKKIAKGRTILGELNDVNGLRLVTLVSLEDMSMPVYDESVVKQYFNITMEDETDGQKCN